MHPAGNNHPCGTKKLAGDTSGRKQSSLRNKKASWGCIWRVEIISVEQKASWGCIWPVEIISTE